MSTEPDTERTVLLAQIALEGVTLSAEVQAACGTGVLRGILATAVYRRGRGLTPVQYVTRWVSAKARVYPAPLLDMCTTYWYNIGCVGEERLNDGDLCTAP